MTTVLMAKRSGYGTDTPAVIGGGVDALLAAATSDVLVLSTQVAAAQSALGVHRQVNYQNLRRGVRYRILTPDLARTAPVLAPQLARLARTGAVIRTAPKIPVNALLVDRTVAVFPADPGPAAGVTMLRLPGVVATTTELFELIWSTAAPLLASDLPETAELEARERKLLSLLAVGFTDAAAADELDISVRTVRRTVSGLMNRLGARSRFMAGVKAAERGWLPERGSPPPSTSIDTMRILVTEDEEDLRLAISVSLRGAGFAVDAKSDLPDADLALAVNAYDCAVFDRRLPSGDALDYVRARRVAGLVVPVLFLTGLDTVPDRISGLEYGDDYLGKPFAMAELVARVRSLCPRGRARRPPTLTCGDLEIDTGRHEVRRAGVLLTLTSREFAVLELLMLNQGNPVRRADLIEHCWDRSLESTSNVLDVLIAQLRRKLRQPPMIHTVRGVGHRIDPVG